MKIIPTETEKKVINIKDKISFSENILSRVVRLLKDEDQTVIGPKLKNIEQEEKKLTEQESNLTTLLIKSEDLKKDVTEKSEALGIENTVIRKKLLEMLNG
jgi:hypothetical protein